MAAVGEIWMIGALEGVEDGVGVTKAEVAITDSAGSVAVWAKRSIRSASAVWAADVKTASGAGVVGSAPPSPLDPQPDAKSEKEARMAQVIIIIRLVMEQKSARWGGFSIQLPMNGAQNAHLLGCMVR